MYTSDELPRSEWDARRLKRRKLTHPVGKWKALSELAEKIERRPYVPDTFDPQASAFRLSARLDQIISFSQID